MAFFKQYTLPQVNEKYTYIPGLTVNPECVFTVVGVDVDTGCLYLISNFPSEITLKVIEKNDKNKYGEQIKVPAFLYKPDIDQYLVNVAWDVWQKQTVRVL